MKSRDHDWERLQALRTHWPRRWSGNGSHAGNQEQCLDGLISPQEMTGLPEGPLGAAALFSLFGVGGGMSDICLRAPDPLCVSTGSGGPLLVAASELPPSLSPAFPQRASLPAHSAYLSAFPLAPPRGLFSHSPSLDLLPLLIQAWRGLPFFLENCRFVRETL